METRNADDLRRERVAWMLLLTLLTLGLYVIFCNRSPPVTDWSCHEGQDSRHRSHVAVSR
jgi:hypothetical protein